jgi:hypothetical protein
MRTVISAFVCDGSGWSPEIESSIGLEILDDRLILISDGVETSVNYSNLISIQIDGHVHKKNAGLVGGGFGTKAAIEGIYKAYIIKTITTRTKKCTTVEIRATDGTVTLLVPDTEEFAMKKLFRKAQDAIVAKAETLIHLNAGTITSELERLGELLHQGILTKAEFQAAKKKLLKD